MLAGHVLYADILSVNGRSKGCGIVEYETAQEALNAISQLSDKELMGRPTFIREVLLSKKRMKLDVMLGS